MRTALLLAFVLAAPACGSPAPESPAPQWCSATGKVFGTTWNAKWSAETCDPQVTDAIAAVLDEVDAQMSTWRADSEINRVRAGEGPVAVSADTALVVLDALALAEASGGAFDPTVQPLMEVWGFHSRERALAEPTPEALEAARAQVGWSRVDVAWVEGVAHIDAGGTALDLSAIAKGHGVDRASGELAARGYANHMVEVGGEVRASGEGPRGAWTLGVDAPVEGNAPGAELVDVIALVDHSLATSGNYRNAVEVDGKRVHHTMDARTGRPATTDVLSASVVARDCRTADALATAVMVLGSEKGLELLEARSDVEGLLVVGAGPSGFETRQTSGMHRFVR